MGPPLFPTVFWCDAPEAGLIGAVSLFKFRRIKHLVVAATTEFVVPRAAPLAEWIRKDGSLPGDRGFESISLQQRVSLSAASAFEGREPRPSARVCAAGLATRSAETRRAFQFAPTCGNISVGPYSSTAVPQCR